MPQHVARRGLFDDIDAMVGFQQPEPLLGWWPAPNAYAEMTVLGRRIPTEVDEFGCRPVPGQPAVGERTLTVYGCSNTFGWTVLAEESYCARLQEMLPAWRVENQGMFGFGTAHNLIQLERAARIDPPDIVTFGWIPHHRHRTVADHTVVQGYQWPRWQRSPIMVHPKAFLNEDGEIEIRTVNFKRPDLKPDGKNDIDLTDFAPDPYYLDLVTFKVFERAHRLVTEAGGRFFVTILRWAMSPALKRMVDDAGIDVLDASLYGLKYTNAPDDGHPNALGHQIFAERIAAHVADL